MRGRQAAIKTSEVHGLNKTQTLATKAEEKITRSRTNNVTKDYFGFANARHLG